MAISTPNAKRAALLIVDVQTDYVSGSMAVPEAKAIVPLVNKVKKNVKWTNVILTQDSHPPGHVSFLDSHSENPKARETEMITVDGCPQKLWPIHCITGSAGEKFHEGLEVEAKDIIIKKGNDKNVDCYSAFYDNLRKPTGMTRMLNEARITDVYVCGLPFDYCVGNTALDSQKNGFNTFIIEDATKFISSQGAMMMRKKLLQVGIKYVHSSELVTTRPDNKRQQAAEYFEKNRIMPLLQRLTALLLHNKPENPKEFLINELKKMKESKTKMDEVSSSLLDDSDLSVVFKTADVNGKGKINSSQCRQALLSVGVPTGEINLDKDKDYTVQEFTQIANEGLKTL